MKKLLAVCALSLAAHSGIWAQCDIATAPGGVCSFPDTATPYGVFTQQSIVFNTQDAGTAQAPEYRDPATAGARLRGIDTSGTGMPLIHLQVNQPALGSGRATYTVHLERAAVFALAGKHLFRLSNGGGLPVYVAAWSSGATTVDIRVDTTGSWDLVFGTLPNMPGKVSASGEVPVFDFADPPAQIALSLTGSSFRTANPLILATPVAAGSWTSPSKAVVSASYPAASAPLKSALAGAGIRALGDSLRINRFWTYYQRLVAAQGTADSGSEKPPLTLNSVSAANTGLFDVAASGAAVTTDVDVAVDASGALSALSLPLRLTASGWKALGKASRGVEVVLSVFDGGSVSRGKAFVRGRFGEAEVNNPSDKPTNPFEARIWNLYSYPWDEQSGGDIARLVEDGVAGNYKVMRYSGPGYENLTAADFSNYVDSGRAFWSGNIFGSYRPGTEGGLSLDFQTFALALAGGKWNDFGLPFNFPVRLKDIADSSPGAGSLNIYRFIPSSQGKAVGSWGLPLSVAGDMLVPWAGYTVKPSSAVTLRVPVRDATRSSAPPAAKTAAGAVWKADIWLRNATALSGLQVAKSRSPHAVGEGPSVPGQDFSAFFQKGERQWSVLHEDAAGGPEGHWSLRIVPGAGFSGVDLTVAGRSGENVPLHLVETLQGLSVELGEAPVHLTARDVEQGDYHIVAGSPDYARSFLETAASRYQSRLANFPNPFFETGTSIRFSLPSTFTDVSYQIRIFDFHGRRVWDKAWKGGPMMDAFWDGRDLSGRPLPSGQYHLKVTARTPGRPSFTAQKNLIKLR